MPLSLCVARKGAFDGWPECTADSMHTGTFFGYPLACETGLVFLHLLSEDGFFESAMKKYEERFFKLRASVDSLKVKDIRNFGATANIEFKEAGHGSESHA